MRNSLLRASCLLGLFSVFALLSLPNSLAADQALDPTVSGNVDLTSGSFVLTPSPFSLFTQQNFASDTYSTAILEFPLASIPSDVTVLSATLDLDVNLYSSGGGEFPEVPVFGYAGNGTAELGDAQANTNLLGLSDPISGLGFISIDLERVLKFSFLPWPVFST